MKTEEVGSKLSEWLSDFGFRALKHPKVKYSHWAACRFRFICSAIRQNERTQVVFGKLMFECLDTALSELEKPKGFLLFYIRSIRRILQDFEIGDRMLSSRALESMKRIKESLLVYASHAIDTDFSLFFVLYNFLENPLVPDQLYNLVFCGCEYGLIDSDALFYKIIDLVEYRLGIDPEDSAS